MMSLEDLGSGRNLLGNTNLVMILTYEGPYSPVVTTSAVWTKPLTVLSRVRVIRQGRLRNDGHSSIYNPSDSKMNRRHHYFGSCLVRSVDRDAFYVFTRKSLPLSPGVYSSSVRSCCY